MKAVNGPVGPTGLSLSLDEFLRRADPRDALILEAVREVARAVIDYDWNESDSFVGYVTLADGGAKIESNGTQTLATGDATNTDQIITGLEERPPTGSPILCLEIAWTNTTAIVSRELDRLTCRLHPDPGGTGRNVTEWRAQLWRQVAYGENSGERYLAPISDIAVVTASGTSAQDVTFDFKSATSSAPVRVGLPPVRGDLPDNKTPEDDWYRKTYLIVWAVEGQGESTSNVAWMGNSGAAATKTAGGYTVRHVQLTQLSAGVPSSYGTLYDLQIQGSGMPTFTLEDVDFSSVVITFSGSNKLDLGASPTEAVEFIGSAQLFDDSDVTFELAVPASGTWVEVVDGDLLGQDNTGSGGTDLSAGGATPLAARQDYDMRVTLTPSTGDFTSPIVRIAGVRERERIDLTGVAVLESYEVAADPVDGHSQIGEAVVRILKDGEVDYRDTYSELFSENHAGQIEIETYVGTTERDASGAYRLPRKHWLRLQSFYVDEHASDLSHGEIRCVDALIFMRGTVPIYSLGTRTPVEYSSEALSAVAEDLLSGQLAVPARHIGPGIVDFLIDDDSSGTRDTTAFVTRTLKEEDGKTMLDGLADLAGGTWIASQGRIKFARLVRDVDEDPNPHPRVEIPVPEGAVRRISAGQSERQDELFVPWGWDDRRDDGRGGYEGEVRSFHTQAIAKLGTHQVREAKVPRTPDSTARWVPRSGTDGGGDPVSGLAELYAYRKTEALGFGMITVPVESTYAYPELEIGDVVAVETDRFVGRNPNDDQPLRGKLWLHGAVVGIHDPMGRSFTIWIRSYADILPGTTQLQRVSYVDPRVLAVVDSVDMTGTVALDVQGNQDALSVRYATSTSAFPSRATTEAGTLVALDATDRSAQVTGLGPLAADDTLYVTVLAFEFADGTGAESVEMFKLAVQWSPPQIAPSFELRPSQSAGTATLTIAINDPQGRVTATAFDADSGADYTPNADPTLWDVYDNSAPFTLSLGISQVPKHGAVIVAGIRYTDQDGNDAWDIKPHRFDSDLIPEVTNIAISFDPDGKAVVSATGDEDVANLYVTVGDGSAPSDPTVGSNDGSISGRTGTVATGVKITTGNDAFVKVVAADSGANLGPVASARLRRGLGPIEVSTGSSVTGSTAETTLETMTIPGGSLGSSGVFMAEALGFCVGTDNTKTLRVYLGGSLVAQVVFPDTFVGAFHVFVRVFNDGDLSDQQVITTVVSEGGLENEMSNSNATVLSTNDMDLEITGQLADVDDEIGISWAVPLLAGAA